MCGVTVVVEDETLWVDKGKTLRVSACLLDEVDYDRLGLESPSPLELQRTLGEGRGRILSVSFAVPMVVDQSMDNV